MRELRVIVDLTELESMDRGKTEEVLSGFDWKKLGERVEVLMRDEEAIGATVEMLRRLGWGERLDEGKLKVETRSTADSTRFGGFTFQ